MLKAVKYVAGTGLERIALNEGGLYVGNPGGLLSREWSYSVGYRGLTGVTRAARSESFDAVFLDLKKADLLRRVCDRDMANGTPGRVYVGEWFQRAYITASSSGKVGSGYMTGKLTIVLLDGLWRRKHVVEIRPQTGASSDSDGGDLPRDLPCDLPALSSRSSVEVDAWQPCPVGFTAYGPLDAFSITLGGNVYKVAASVPDGARLTVDPISRSVTIIDRDGSEADAFPQASRGTGLGSGSYIFEPVGIGANELTFAGSPSFDIEWYEEEGEPPWC